MKFKDTVATGTLTVRKEYADNTVETIIEDDPNVIMYKARRVHLDALHVRNAPQDLISTFQVGIGGAIGSDSEGNDNIRVIPPDPSKGGLYNAVTVNVNDDITIYPSDMFEEPTDVYIKIKFSLSQDECNGFQINECGLFKESGTIFNHKTFHSIEKNESFSLIFEWTIRYV